MGKLWSINVLVLMLLMFLPEKCISTPKSNFSDQSALLAFKAHIIFDPQNLLQSNWSSETSFRNWMGVSCSLRRQRVTALNLSSMGLMGTIPPQLGNLSFLQFLDLRNNSFHDHLPNDIGSLRRLKAMDMRFNDLSGVIPESFGNLHKLQYFRFFKSSLTGSLQKLSSISLSNNSFQGSIPESFGDLVALEILDFLRGQIPSGGPFASFTAQSFMANKALCGPSRLQDVDEEYLHHGYSTPVVHCDLKPSNVLLDEDMVAHVCDFGIAKLLGESESIAQTKTLATSMDWTDLFDVHSFGIMLMEIFTRKKPTDEMFEGEMSLKRLVKESFPDSVIDIVDGNMLNTGDGDSLKEKHCVTSIMELALQCTNESPQERINMVEILARLKKIKGEVLRAWAANVSDFGIEKALDVKPGSLPACPSISG
ncbi:unnamed protein product [Dovyalis caffra]|uniref:Protein kinase domain-containing protein n=1 Tax=Dovyalis caffra TaxID=77055 RepID=A0AAV1RUC1_9ROSI|nr:unnamed protein product [Dovyalis caffra]